VYSAAVRFAAVPLVLIAAACAAAGGAGIPGGPTISHSMNDEPQPVGPAIQSNDVLARDAQANQVRVKHILIGWNQAGREGDLDPRAAARTRDEADELAVALLERLRGGEAIEPLMAEHSEDPGSAASGGDYEVTPSAAVVFPFKRLALRLRVGEAGLVLSDFGWHVMQRIE